jgi:hypothetical protein
MLTVPIVESIVSLATDALESDPSSDNSPKVSSSPPPWIARWLRERELIVPIVMSSGTMYWVGRSNCQFPLVTSKLRLVAFPPGTGAPVRVSKSPK